MNNITSQQITEIAKALGSALSLFVPGYAPFVVAATGIIELIDRTLLPIVESFHGGEASVARQALVAVRTQALEIRVGVPPAAHN